MSTDHYHPEINLLIKILLVNKGVSHDTFTIVVVGGLALSGQQSLHKYSVVPSVARGYRAISLENKYT